MLLWPLVLYGALSSSYHSWQILLIDVQVVTDPHPVPFSDEIQVSGSTVICSKYFHAVMWETHTPVWYCYNLMSAWLSYLTSRVHDCVICSSPTWVLNLTSAWLCCLFLYFMCTFYIVTCSLSNEHSVSRNWSPRIFTDLSFKSVHRTTSSSTMPNEIAVSTTLGAFILSCAMTASKEKLVRLSTVFGQWQQTIFGWSS